MCYSVSALLRYISGFFTSVESNETTCIITFHKRKLYLVSLKCMVHLFISICILHSYNILLTVVAVVIPGLVVKSNLWNRYSTGSTRFAGKQQLLHAIDQKIIFEFYSEILVFGIWLDHHNNWQDRIASRLHNM